MYAHQVIEDLKTTPQWVKKESAMTAASFINQSVKFHVGDWVGFQETMPSSTVVDMLLERPSQIRMPYKKTYIDGELSNGDFSGKFAHIVEELDEGLFLIYTFFYKQKVWFQTPTSFLISTEGKTFSEFDLSEIYENHDDEKFGELSIAELILDNHAPPEMIKNAEKTTTTTMRDMCKFICIFCSLLSCKNIETADNPPPERLNKKRIKSGKQPLFTYKTLVIKPTGKQQQSTPRHLWENRIHLCRGHFKTYTEDAPLFGRFTGRYWWQPSVRGRNKDGVVMKDYKVEA